MPENKLEMEVTLKQYDEDGWFICPLCPYDALKYGELYCIQCGVRLRWDSDLLKIKAVEKRVNKGDQT